MGKSVWEKRFEAMVAHMEKGWCPPEDVIREVCLRKKLTGDPNALGRGLRACIACWSAWATAQVPDDGPAPAAEVSGEPTLAEWIGDLDGIGPQTPPLCRDLREGGLDE